MKVIHFLHSISSLACLEWQKIPYRVQTSIWIRHMWGEDFVWVEKDTIIINNHTGQNNFIANHCKILLYYCLWKKSVEMASSIFSGKIQGRTGLSPSQLPVKVFWAFSLGAGWIFSGRLHICSHPWWSLDTLDAQLMSQRSSGTFAKKTKSVSFEISISSFALSMFWHKTCLIRISRLKMNTRLGRLKVWHKKFGLFLRPQRLWHMCCRRCFYIAGKANEGVILRSEL